MFWKLGHPNVDVAFKIFDSRIAPILLYGSEIWGFESWNQIEKIYLRFCKFVFGIGQSANSVKELRININNATYIPTDDSFETIMKSHNQFITSIGLEMSEEDQNLSYLYWAPKLHKSLYKHRIIAGSSKCTTKELSCLITKVLNTIKDGLVRYCNTKTSRSGVKMWILKNSTSLLSSVDQLDVCTATSVQYSNNPQVRNHLIET